MTQDKKICGTNQVYMWHKIERYVTHGYHMCGTADELMWHKPTNVKTSINYQLLRVCILSMLVIQVILGIQKIHLHLKINRTSNEYKYVFI